MPQSARDKFKIGDRVEMTPEGSEQLVRHRRPYRGIPEPSTGVVVGFAHSPMSVRILRDGRKMSQKYHIAFWRAQRKAR